MVNDISLQEFAGDDDDDLDLFGDETEEEKKAAEQREAAKASSKKKERPKKLCKVELSRELPPSNEQFLLDFKQLQIQFPDQVQLHAVTESALISLVIQCCIHAPRAEFLLFALRSLCSIGYINWDTFLPSLLLHLLEGYTQHSRSKQSPEEKSVSVKKEKKNEFLFIFFLLFV
ncbi:unnamed protein product [Fraxinus pennsylvanica]|uniref:Uncharacterized protein n=1 Tax=Fraxinus pennsylvanica TaxID=56036 RepID=A0AAD2DRQ6_9LAMI|nr:unnamed protein product [Fraxinus pennsylvanica]